MAELLPTTASLQRLPELALSPAEGALGPSAVPPDEPALDWRRWRMATWRRRWWILGLTALGTLGGAAASRVLPPRYLAQATIWIQAEPRGGTTNRGPIGADQLLPAGASVDLLRSYMVLDAVVRDRRLYLVARPRDRVALESLTVRDQFQGGRYRLQVDETGRSYGLTADKGIVVEQGTVGDSVGRAIGFVWAPSSAVLPPGSDVKFTLTPLRDAAKGLAEALKVTIDQSGNFLRVSLTDTDAAEVAATVNAVAQRYVTVAAELKRGKSTELARLLDDQLAAARENLQRAENALAAFRMRTITLAPDPAAPPPPAAASGTSRPSSDYFALRLEAEELRRDREAIARALAQPTDSNATIEALSYIGAVQRSADLTAALKEATTKRAELRALRYRYTDDHPTVRRLAEDVTVLERRTIPALARTVRSQLDARAEALAPEITAGGRQLQAIPQRAVEEAQLRREADIAAALYTVVQQRQAEARLAEASTIPDARILDAAVAPRTPLKDTAPRLIALGLLFGLALGLFGAVVADRLDPRVRYREQVTQQMGLQILGLLPHVKNRDAGPDDEQVRQLVEAMRTIRLSVVHAYGPARPLLVTVTSPGIGDGKSFVSTNLALAFAQAGQRTLLIDGDTRRGSLHKQQQLPRKPGLTDCLVGRVPLEAVLRRSKTAALDFIAAGSRLRESPELLGSTAMVDLIQRVRGDYRVILLDSPPLGSGIDPYTLGTLAGNIMLVLRTGTTNLELTRTGLEMLKHLPIRLLGAVLNDVRPGGLYGYYSYLSGYGTTDEAGEESGGVGTRVEIMRRWEPPESEPAAADEPSEAGTSRASAT